ncbi:RNA polymerase sigma factor [Paraliomyxa miuraensis]|uniref:RNA polymerase sigma factor n=1 Tax=Paraliomyxa miuraensis TaxID=376150 RepID=UPI002254E705|nr:RNA polymerase sigma factor [Paraliomyxa miuraensis]MCX4243601.1 RNA polymerase sigma factor [Paraliomyxa miuraensis]
MQDDVQLLQAWRAGDNDAGSRLLRRHFRTLFRFFRSKVGHGVEDLVQQTMLACADGVHRFRGEASFKTYLLAIARTQLLMHLRKHARKDKPVVELETSVADVLGSPSLEVAGKDEQRLVLHALRHIPVDLQIAVELHYWEEMRVEDIAVVVGIPPGTVKSRLHRARRLVREQIEHAEAVPQALRESTAGDLDRWAMALREKLGERSASEDG